MSFTIKNTTISFSVAEKRDASHNVYGPGMLKNVGVKQWTLTSLIARTRAHALGDHGGDEQNQ